MRIGMVTPIVPVEAPDRLRKYSVLLVDPLHRFGEPVDDIEIGTAVGNRLHSAEAPLRPAPAVDDAPLFLDPGRGGENEHFGRDSRRVGARPLPESRRLVLEQIGDHHPVELVEPGTDQTRIGAAHCGVLAETKESLYFAGEHGMGEREKRIALFLKAATELRKVSEVEVILAGGMLAPPSFRQPT